MDNSIYVAVPWDTADSNGISSNSGGSEAPYAVSNGDHLMESPAGVGGSAASSSRDPTPLSNPGRSHFDPHTNSSAMNSSNSIIDDSSNTMYRRSISYTTSTSAAAAIAAAARSLSITVSDPQKHGEGSSAFVSYLVSAHTSLAGFKSTDPSVRRRFQDFVLLQKMLADAHPACIIPPLPGKHRMEYITGDRFGPEFIEKRRISLQSYVDRISRHPILQQSVHLQRFLEVEQMTTYDHPRRESHVFENIGDVFLNAFSKIRKPDERFVEIKEAVDKFEQNLANVEKLHSRLIKHQAGLAADYIEFGSSVTSLGMMETQVSQPLGDFGNRTPAYSQAITEKIMSEEHNYVNRLSEYMSYCQSVKDVLKARDQKQVEHEELANWLSSHKSDRERTMSTGKSPGITGFFKDKINDLKGVDPEKARQIRLIKLDARIEELEEAVGQSNVTADSFSKQVVREIDAFQTLKVLDFTDYLQEYINAQLIFHEKGVKFWESMIPIADTVSLDESLKTSSKDELTA
ncbi:hypothetical protein BASA50_003390 [Batrachochytrium salamandrivorans]|uniref:Sorting nexin-4 n=1 Tax=Batrachochytrium salamandrivorans TaxID=1357716 RepID=A0ABQ8FIS6_9FUNG|nr:hypothetical protein BASA60_008239 [Batrachochytrium salamandrivorans]KAH6572295.1 hypothetical protein BASA62_003444 [Batrachochytrium salamandrivorans]KAH6589150.1 hypothetical protein BASA61_005713 [Batrachochytrium salamandrivorans]KAH6598883.1 hypothetical protein BASA50_003390 [Batrachochytrium salamandrivorans]KAH9273684.1 hypothetical protein BASA83_004017 [Batrachochytrium salamandrivorans]